MCTCMCTCTHACNVVANHAQGRKGDGRPRLCLRYKEDMRSVLAQHASFLGPLHVVFKTPRAKGIGGDSGEREATG